ncbi:MAG TPA: phosphotransferase [Polyangiaceae bacterium LLY-WYZ-14_1]|nr:phosphotransferase [Polyangiaceae bacterium LLY-WYZ-14_1]
MVPLPGGGMRPSTAAGCYPSEVAAVHKPSLRSQRDARSPRPRPGELSPAVERAFGRVRSFRVEAMNADASSRSYARLVFDDDGTPGSAVAMILPEDPYSSDELTSPQDPTPTEVPFLAVQRFLARRGVRVPAVLDAAVADGLILLEDLGRRSFRDRLRALSPADRVEAYRDAVSFLADLHRRAAPPEDPVASLPTAAAGAPLPHRRRFDAALLRAELDEFHRFGVSAAWGSPGADADRRLSQALDALAVAVAHLPTGFVHRDFSSRNLMCLDDGGLAAIDFQDALIGPRPYDLAALLCDSYATLDERHLDSLIRQYRQALGIRGDAGDAFDAGFWAVVAQRKLKDAGRFVRIHRERGDPRFLRWYPPSLAHVARALRRWSPGGRLAEVLAEVVPGFPHALTAPATEVGPGRE